MSQATVSGDSPADLPDLDAPLALDPSETVSRPGELAARVIRIGALSGALVRIDGVTVVTLAFEALAGFRTLCRSEGVLALAHTFDALLANGDLASFVEGFVAQACQSDIRAITDFRKRLIHVERHYGIVHPVGIGIAAIYIYDVLRGQRVD